MKETHTVSPFQCSKPAGGQAPDKSLFLWFLDAISQLDQNKGTGLVHTLNHATTVCKLDRTSKTLLHSTRIDEGLSMSPVAFATKIKQTATITLLGMWKLHLHKLQPIHTHPALSSNFTQYHSATGPLLSQNRWNKAKNVQILMLRLNLS